MYQLTDKGLILSEPIPNKQAPWIAREFLRTGEADSIKNLDYTTQIQPLGKEVISMFIWKCFEHDVVLKESVIRKIIMDGNARIVRITIRYLSNPYPYAKFREGPNTHFDINKVFDNMSDAIHVKLWKTALHSPLLMVLATHMPLRSLPLALGVKTRKWSSNDWYKVVEQRLRDQK